MKRRALVVGTAALALVAFAACGSDSNSGGGATTTAGGGAATTLAPLPSIPMQQELGKGEGALNIIAWAGYAEDGSTDPAYNWVKPFEDQTGCKTNVKIGNTSDEMVSLMKTGQYDGVSASGDATLRLVYGGDVAPVNTALVPNYKDLSPFLKDQPYNSVNGQMYGIPHGWGANLLMYNTDVVKPAPDSWGSVFDPSSPYKGKVTAYDSPIYIADAGLYLMKTQPDLGIKNPYALDQKQFDAAVELLKKQKSIIGEYWSDYAKSQQAWEQGSTVLGTTWQVIKNLAAGNKAPVETVLPKESSTGWSDTWMISSKAKNPNCMYLWMDYVTSPDVQAQISEYYGEAPANPLACDKTSDKTHCDTYKAKDEAFNKALYLWTTPIKDCLDGRGPICVPYTDWIKAWTEVKG